MTLSHTAAPVDPFTDLVRDVAVCACCARVAHTHTLSHANGPLDARVLFTAEAPGRLGAARTGIPLSGDAAGRRFEALLAVAGLRRSDVFVTNAVLCNPLDAVGCNRTPSVREVTACRPFLARTFDLVGAPVVVALGRVALESLRAIEPHDADLPRDAPQAFNWRGRRLIVLYHPGRQSLLHRSERHQRRDWEALGALISGL